MELRVPPFDDSVNSFIIHYAGSFLGTVAVSRIREQVLCTLPLSCVHKNVFVNCSFFVVAVVVVAAAFEPMLHALCVLYWLYSICVWKKRDRSGIFQEML